MPLESQTRSRAGRKTSSVKIQSKEKTPAFAVKPKEKNPFYNLTVDLGKEFVVQTGSVSNSKVKRFGKSIGRRDQVKKAYVTLLLGAGETVKLNDAGPDIENLYSTLEGVQRQVAAFSTPSPSVAKEKTAEQRTIDWLAAEADRLRTVVASRVEADRAHQRAMRIAAKTLKEGL